MSLDIYFLKEKKVYKVIKNFTNKKKKKSV